MRLLRALACFVLALTLVAAPVAHARPIGAMPTTESHHGDPAAAAMTHHAVPDCDGPSREYPVQGASDCQAACCFMPVQLPPRLGMPTAVEFRRLPYLIAAQVLTGRARAPDPEIPKHA